MWTQYLWNLLLVQTSELIEWAKCGNDYVSTVPTILWAIGASAFAHRLLVSMFRRFMFRRVALWELVLQHLLFVWMVLYSLHFWHVSVGLIKLFIDYCDEEVSSFLGLLTKLHFSFYSSAYNLPNDVYILQGEILIDEEKLATVNIMQQWVIWLFGVSPLAVYWYTRPRRSSPPIMIWITSNPWQRREMGPYGYYLNRPFSSLQSLTNLSLHERTLTLRRAVSDSKIIIREPPKKKRISKSI
ncbi:uncharacterized protein LOC106711592 [Papilio machaon]|uniref:uncharacterized protein LOC106711592 n=1 Tax=Papilio machaon TaxID=76193 RepID=UPI001E663C28|nr:uncharacterized protein LOC106711592 [Papilio machaon]